MKAAPIFASFVAVLVGPGCAAHMNSRAVEHSLKEKRATFSDPLIARAYRATPAIHFPATIAIASTDSRTREHIRAISAHGALDAWGSLPQLARPVTISPLLLDSSSGENRTAPDLRLREAAAKLHADAVLILATETQVNDGRIIAPLTELSLGLLPNKRYELIATSLAALVDTRTGYIYGTIEKSRFHSGITMAWGGDDVIRRARAKVEREAMEKLFADFPEFWRGVVAHHHR